MRWILWSAAVAGLALGGSTGTFAQGMGMMGMQRYDAKPRAVRPAPPAKRYYYRGDTRTSGCKVYQYWSNGRCVDARTTPPDLN